MPSYEVRGRGKEINRAIKRVYSAYDEAEARAMAESNSTVVESVRILPDDPPTEAQLSYAKDLGIVVSNIATKNDVCDMISCRVNHDKPATERHKSFARMYRVEYTEYVGKRKLFNMIFAALHHPSRTIDMVSWFVYRVYRELVHGADDAPIKGPENPIIKEIAQNIASDSSVVKSIRRYEGSELIWFGEWTSPDGLVHTGGSNRTTAYKRASSLLREKLNLSSQSSRPSQYKASNVSSISISHRSPSSEGVTFGTLLKLIIIVGIIVFVLWLIMYLV
jgi:hypothetical protein